MRVALSGLGNQHIACWHGILCGHLSDDSADPWGFEASQQAGISSARGDGTPCGANG
jgi:hypothetical protein